MGSMLLYLFWGVVNIFTIELILDYVDRKVGLDRKVEFTNFNRLILILLWPIYTFVFWYNFFKSLFENKE